jgi:hypothetical protein
MTKTVTSKIHEWTMIELRKRNRAREQNVYKTKGPDITDENYRHPILRSTDGKKLEEMDKEWEMIFDLEWNEDLKIMVPKFYGHQLDRMTNIEKSQYMGVTPRGIEEYGRGEWEPTLGQS